MNKRKNISSNTIWENIVGYSRAVRIGNTIEVSGTTAVDGENVVGVDDAYVQTKFILNKIETALKEAGATMNDVTRTRIFVTDIDDWEEIAKAHAEFFSEIKPATTLLEVNKLISRELLVEIEVTAMVIE